MEDFTVVQIERLQKLEEDERLLNEIEAEALCRLGYGALHKALCDVHRGDKGGFRGAFARRLKEQGAI